MFKRILFISLFFIMSPSLIFASVTDYLILQDIVPYKLFTGISGRVFSGPPSKFSQTTTGGVLEAAGHFSEGDDTYSASYTEAGGKWPFVKVVVTQHAGSDSDRWLLHEVEDAFRDSEIETLGLLTDGAVMRRIGSHRVLGIGIGGGSFIWLNNNTVIKISYVDLQATKPEPIEVIQAYLVKFPSTITLTDAELKSNVHNVQWIKDEMERQLWLCDKWNVQFQAGKVTQYDLLQALVKSMTVFLNYRQKYYSITATDDINAFSVYLKNNDAASIQAKLSSYKAWWLANKARAISL